MGTVISRVRAHTTSRNAVNRDIIRPVTSTPLPSSPPHRGRVAVTVVIPTLNEASRITDALANLRWADEVMVVDGGSTDETVALAGAAGARVLTVLGQTIAAQRNAGIEASRNRWVLALDADERVSEPLRAELESLLASTPPHAAYRIKFENHYLGRILRHGPWGRDWHVRLFTSDRRFGGSRVHERLEPIEDIGTLRGTIIHTPYRDLPHHIAKVVKYAQWGADDLYARGRGAGLWEMSMRPAWRFLRDYIAYSGWRDGVVGFIAAVVSGFAAFLKYAFLFVRGRTSKS